MLEELKGSFEKLNLQSTLFQKSNPTSNRSARCWASVSTSTRCSPPPPSTTQVLLQPLTHSEIREFQKKKEALAESGRVGLQIKELEQRVDRVKKLYQVSPRI